MSTVGGLFSPLGFEKVCYAALVTGTAAPGDGTLFFPLSGLPRVWSWLLRERNPGQGDRIAHLPRSLCEWVGPLTTMAARALGHFPCPVWPSGMSQGWWWCSGAVTNWPQGNASRMSACSAHSSHLPSACPEYTLKGSTVGRPEPRTWGQTPYVQTPACHPRGLVAFGSPLTFQSSVSSSAKWGQSQAMHCTVVTRNGETCLEQRGDEQVFPHRRE